jgi:hypothetical protein
MSKKFSSPNSISVKMHNRRVTVFDENDKFVIQFKIMTDNPEPLTMHFHRRGLTATEIAISKESAEYMAMSILELLNREQ